MPTTTDAFNQAVLAQLATVEEQRFLFWQVDQAQQGAVIELIERLDVPFASQADGIALMVKQAALPVLVKWAKQAWPADDELQSSLEALTKETAILWRAGRFTFNVTAHPLVYGILNVTPDSFMTADATKQPTTSRPTSIRWSRMAPTSLRLVAKRPSPVALWK